MPTGYTVHVGNGNIQDFRTFCLQCARACGACATMREDSMDKPIPEAFPIDQWHVNKLNDALDEYKKLCSLTEQELTNIMNDDYERQCKSYKEAESRMATTKANYEQMLKQVHNWQPPTSDHQGLKDFMIEQLKSSIEWDCQTLDAPDKPSFTEWLEKRKESLINEIDYHTKEYKAEVDRVNGRNEWIKQLRKSLYNHA